MTNHGKPATTRRRFISSVAVSMSLAAHIVPGRWFPGAHSEALAAPVRPNSLHAFSEMLRIVAPPKGHVLSVVFGEALQRLIGAGAIAPGKFRRLYAGRGGLPTWVDRLLTAPSYEPIRLSVRTAPYLLNLLWPLGLATKTAFNTRSPINQVSLPTFASTGGWQLGQAANGYVYFNQVEAVRLNQAQEAIVLKLAREVFRPCCNNSTFFQDCNHGSALLGLFELAASQGSTATELYRIGLAANSYWYPRHYAEIALYFFALKNRMWTDVPPATILGPHLSSASGWRRNVHAPLQAASLLPRTRQRSQQGCGV